MLEIKFFVLQKRFYMKNVLLYKLIFSLDETKFVDSRPLSKKYNVPFFLGRQLPNDHPKQPRVQNQKPTVEDQPDPQLLDPGFALSFWATWGYLLRVVR